MFKKRSYYQSQDRPDSDWGPTHSVSSVNRTIAPLTINSWLQTASLYGTPFAERCWIPWNLKFKVIVFTYDSKPMLGCQNTSTSWVSLRNRNLELRFPHLYVLPLFIDPQKFYDELLVVNGQNRSATFLKMALRFGILEGAHRQATKSHKQFFHFMVYQNQSGTLWGTSQWIFLCQLPVGIMRVVATSRSTSCYPSI